MSFSSSFVSLRTPSCGIKFTSLVFFVLSAVGAAHAQGADSPVYGVHDFELQGDVDAGAFERYIIEKLVPAWAQPRNGLRMTVLKGDRGERKGKYQLVYIFESVKKRDGFFPTEGGPASELFEQTMAPVAEVMQGLEKFPGVSSSFTDYSPVGDYMPPKQPTTPVIAVRNIELGNDVDPKEFERYLKEKFAPVWKQPREGLQLVFLKGDRGARKGKFQFAFVFDSIEVRNEFFPKEGGEGSGKAAKVIEAAGAVMQELQQFPFTTSEAYTDYYPLNGAL